jgi:GcrA cell cycle regulator
MRSTQVTAQERTAAVARMHADGVPSEAIAARLGMCVRAVYARVSRIRSGAPSKPKPPGAYHPAGFWTDERLTVLRTLWAEGLTALQIGTQIGATRNAVLGKVHRMGFAIRNVPVAGEQRQPRSAKQNGPRPYRLPKIAMLLAVAPPPRSHIEGYSRRPLEYVPPTAPLNIPFLEHKTGQCREITGHDGLALFCGHPAVEGCSWCAHHRSVNFQKPTHRLNDASADYFSGARQQAARAL